MQEPNRTRTLLRGAIAFFVFYTLILGGLAWLFFALGSLFVILAVIILLIWAVFTWRAVIQVIALLRGEW